LVEGVGEKGMKAEGEEAEASRKVADVWGGMQQGAADVVTHVVARLRDSKNGGGREHWRGIRWYPALLQPLGEGPIIFIPLRDEQAL